MGFPAKNRQPVLRPWTVKDSEELYQVKAWGKGYFTVSEEGTVEVLSGMRGRRGLDMAKLVNELVERGLNPPLLLRFGDILEDRIRNLNEAFHRAIVEYGFRGSYRGVFPVKVNQQRQVIEELVNFGRPYGLGLEAGSKPELLVALAMHADPESLIICNGFKDREYIEMAMLAAKLGKQTFLVIDRLAEVDLCVEAAGKFGVRPSLGIRVRLVSKGAGKWTESSGDHSKFGLSSEEILEVVRILKEHDLCDCLEMLHFHIGSQITDIRAVKAALREASRIYVELVGLGAPMGWVDVGGGLGVDYDGSRTNFPSSMNYTLQEYANDVVDSIRAACDEASVSHPYIVSESGRAMVAHHSVLVFDVVGISDGGGGRSPEPVVDGDPEVVRDLHEVLRGLSTKNYLEGYHDALQLREETMTRFNLGLLDLKARARCETLFASICRKVLKLASEEEELPEELEPLERSLSEIYFCNFSVFQSIPDHWAVKQLFPVMPIQDLDRRPTRKAVLADLTCDSDGKMDRFIDPRDVAQVVSLHDPEQSGKPYYVGVFLVGAYQEVLGDLHNLFGDTNVVHVRMGEDGEPDLYKVVEGDSVREVLSYVQYDPEDLVARVRNAAEGAIREGRIRRVDVQELLRRYKGTLERQTYLET